MTLSLKTLPAMLAAALLSFVLAAAVLIALDAAPRRSPRSTATLPSQPRPGAPTLERIAAYERIVRARPALPAGYALLAAAHLQRVRETGDSAYYVRAAGVLARGLQIAPTDAALLTERSALELSRHDFRAGLRDAQAVHRADPTLHRPYGVLVDALVELGRYREAGAALQEMIDRKPDLAGYARVSYFRELQGDLPGAASALALAISAGGASPENVAYAQTLLGNLRFAQGDLPAARRAYREARYRFAGAVAAEAGLAKVDAAQRRLGDSITGLREVVARLPLPEYVVALGDAELAAGRTAAARRDLQLVRVEQRLLAAGGVNTDVDMALFEADHGSPVRGAALARQAWAAAPSVRSADALGWALARSGHPREALPWTRRALRLGTRDALVLYHAGMTAKAAGRRALARTWLRRALANNPRFSPLYGPRAARALRGL